MTLFGLTSGFPEDEGTDKKVRVIEKIEIFRSIGTNKSKLYADTKHTYMHINAP